MMKNQKQSHGLKSNGGLSLLPCETLSGKHEYYVK